MMMRKHGYIPLHSIASDAAPALSPESAVMGLDAQVAEGSLVHMEGAQVSKT